MHMVGAPGLGSNDELEFIMDGSEEWLQYKVVVNHHFGGMELCTPLYSSLQDEYSGMHIRFNFKLEGDEILSQKEVPTVESDVELVQDLRRIVRTSFIMYH